MQTTRRFSNPKVLYPFSSGFAYFLYILKYIYFPLQTPLPFSTLLLLPTHSHPLVHKSNLYLICMLFCPICFPPKHMVNQSLVHLWPFQLFFLWNGKDFFAKFCKKKTKTFFYWWPTRKKSSWLQVYYYYCCCFMEVTMGGERRGGFGYNNNKFSLNRIVFAANKRCQLFSREGGNNSDIQDFISWGREREVLEAT